MKRDKKLKPHFFNHSQDRPLPVSKITVIDPALIQEIEIGSIVHFSPKRVFENYPKDDFRPGLVQALWRDGKGILKKIEVLPFTSNITKIYASDFACLDQETMEFFNRQKKGKLRTEQVFIVDCELDSFSCVSKRFLKIDDVLWTDILLRRANAILLNPEAKVYGYIDESLYRVGFCFRDIAEKNVRAENLPPDIGADIYIRVSSDIISPDDVDAIAAYSAAYSAYLDENNGLKYKFPRLHELPQEIEMVDFPDWGWETSPENSETYELEEADVYEELDPSATAAMLPPQP